MKKIIIRAGVLAAIFIVAVIGFSFITNRENTDMTVDIQSATFPYISFKTGDIEVNPLVGHTEEMDIPTLRDTITPVSDYKVRMNINEGAGVKLCKYAVYSLDGEEVLYENIIEQPEKENVLEFDQEGLLESEKVLRVMLRMENDQEVYYYTRIVDSEPMNVGMNLAYIQSFFNTEHDKTAFAEYKDKMEPDASADNRTFQTVTIQSDFDNISWGELEPRVIDNVSWSLKEINSTYTSVELDYRVICNGEENEYDTYNIKEFFRVRSENSSVYLLDYYRTMNQIFDGSKEIVDQKGIILGINEDDVEYLCDKEGAMVTFVVEREVWSFNKNTGEISMVFRFDSDESKDIRYRYAQHDVRLILVEEDGSTTFTVEGYMNRGVHEGQTGVAIYYFDSEKNAVEEKAFIASKKSYAVLQKDEERMVYYNNKNQVVHVLLEGKLYEIDLEEETRNILVEDLLQGQYVSSEDGHMFAYAKEGEEGAPIIQVMNLSSGKSYEVKANEGENVCPLGFVNNDFVYGVERAQDEGRTISGEALLPMYKVEITDSSLKIQKTYEIENIYLSDIFVENGLITVNRVSRVGDLYTSIEPDYISSNEEKDDSNITLESYTTDLKKRQLRLAYQNGLKNQRIKLLQPKQVVFKSSERLELEESPSTGKYYVYAHGELQNVYNKASYAVNQASELLGVAVTSEQLYVWERIGRDDTYVNENIEVFQVQEGESALMACLRRVIEYEGNSVDIKSEFETGKTAIDILAEYSGGEALDLTGCGVEEILYMVGKGRPVIAVIDESQAILLVGYDSQNITYLNPLDGTMNTVSTQGMEDMVNGSGNTFIAYTK